MTMPGWLCGLAVLATLFLCVVVAKMEGKK